MNWEVWIVPIIALAVWILGSLLRGAQQGMQEGQQQGNRPRRSTSTLDEFFRETQRRREQADREARAEERRRADERRQSGGDEPVVARTVSRRRRRPEDSERPTRVMEPAEPSILPVVIAVEERQPFPVALPVSAPAAKEAVVLTEPGAATPAVTFPIAQVMIRKAKLAPAVVQLRQMLRMPQTLRTAMMLREVLDPPLCRRKKGLK